ncbi:hypothetical protein HPG69_006054 [Diceros bicornis minor]|uniref:Uncharacterized protein n=1 Tax=Diceros bicornis minor TaxID=77932 RepID=A0A7J7EV42_DICBM|nr:hypothetical protein HPG69_006054 [Diceros bicornis minor]
MENLHADDARTYWGRIEMHGMTDGLDGLSPHPVVQVVVSVCPGETLPLQGEVKRGTSEEAAPCLSPCPSQVPTQWRPLPAPGLPRGALLLSMLGAVLWVNRPQRGPGGRQSQSDQGNPPCSALCP